MGYVDRFGAQSVMGRPLGYHEIQHMVLMDNIIRAYHARAEAAPKEGGWAKWEQDNPQAARLLNEAMLLAERGE